MTTTTPDIMPVLSKGGHPWGPRDGGCFMEVASYLAGLDWSDNPECTDASLAALCRAANDKLPDKYRQQIAHLIPDVIGTRVDLEVRHQFLEWLGETVEDSVFRQDGRLYALTGWMNHMQPEELVEAITRIIKGFRRIAGLDPAPVSDSEWRDAKALVSA